MGGRTPISDCCSVNAGTSPAVMTCPVTGTRSEQMDVLTIRSLIRQLPLGMPNAAYFCEAADCDVVYFAFQAQAPIFRRGDLLVRVGSKETSDPIPVFATVLGTRENISAEARPAIVLAKRGIPLANALWVASRKSFETLCGICKAQRRSRSRCWKMTKCYDHNLKIESRRNSNQYSRMLTDSQRY